jgi:hypothetical protein
MDDKQRCQSCGMPLSAEFGNFGTGRDGNPVEDYCTFCFADGGFRNPGQTLEEMIQSSIDNMTNDLGMPLERATELANSVIPALGRWNK